MMQCDRTMKRPAGFTLIELILGVMILTLVVGAVHGTLKMGMTAYSIGQAEMELYQGVRVGLNRVADLLRGALSPSAFWRPGDQIVPRLMWEEMRYFLETGEMVEEDEPGPIQFSGTSDEVIFARKVFGGTSDKIFDIQEIRIYLDDDRQELRLELVKSLLDIKIASWYFAYLYDTDLSGQIIMGPGGEPRRVRRLTHPGEPPLDDFVGDVGMDGRSMPLVPGIKEVEFSYFDGEGWHSSWDSREIVEIPLMPFGPSRDRQFDPELDVIRQEKGLPAAVSITFTLENNETLGVKVDVPAGGLNHLLPSGKPPPRAGAAGESPVARPGGMMFRRSLRRSI